MNRLLAVLGLSLSPLLLGLVCPTIPPPLPATLGPPQIVSLEIGAYEWDGRLREGVRLNWLPPLQDSVAVTSYSIFRLIEGDSTFTRIQHQRPANLTSYVDRSDRIGSPANATFVLAVYKVVGIDSLGRPSDTSKADTIGIAPQPSLDSTALPLLSWRITGNGFGFYTYASLWDSAGQLLWNSTRPLLPVYAQENEIRVFSVQLPDTLALTSGTKLSWGAHVNHVSGTGYPIGSLRITQCVWP